MSEVLVVIVVVSIASENVTAMVVLTETKVAESAGVVLTVPLSVNTVGAVVSTVNEVKVMVFPVFPARSVIVTVQSE